GECGAGQGLQGSRHGPPRRTLRPEPRGGRPYGRPVALISRTFDVTPSTVAVRLISPLWSTSVRSRNGSFCPGRRTRTPVGSLSSQTGLSIQAQISPPAFFWVESKTTNSP